MNTYSWIAKIIADDIIDMKEARNKFSRHIHIKIPYDSNNKELLKSIKSLVTSHSGECRFIINEYNSNKYNFREITRLYNKKFNTDENMFKIKTPQKVGLIIIFWEFDYYRVVF